MPNIAHEACPASVSGNAWSPQVYVASNGSRKIRRGISLINQATMPVLAFTMSLGEQVAGTHIPYVRLPVRRRQYVAPTPGVMQ